MATGYTELAARVSDALGQQKETKDLGIEVLDKNGVVTLIGQVKSGTAREAAEEIARQQQGVVSVVNALELACPDDEDIVEPAHAQGFAA